MTVLLVLFTFAIERGIPCTCKRKRKAERFCKNLQNYLANDKIEDAIIACDKQERIIANVMKAVYSVTGHCRKDVTLSKDQKILALQKEFEEATALEYRCFHANLVILSTIASISVLIGLLGTVLGMIRAFGALAQAGARMPLPLQPVFRKLLSTRHFGITGSLLGIVMYNFYSSQIDSFTYKIDEAGFSLVQSFAAQEK